MPTPDAAQENLPLKQIHFVILLALLDADLYGYALVQDIEQRTNGSVRLEPGNLYRFIRELLSKDLIAESGMRSPGRSAERRRYYTITPLGRRVVRAEAARMKALVRQVERLEKKGRMR